MFNFKEIVRLDIISNLHCHQNTYLERLRLYNAVNYNMYVELNLQNNQIFWTEA